MRVSLDKNLVNTSEGVRLFEFDNCPGVLNEDLLKAITGAGAAVLAIGLTKAVAAHNLMAIKKYMKTVVDLAINGKGKKWNEPSYQSITNDEKRNALMITYQLAKYAAIYDYSKDGSSMFNSYIEMPNIPGGSDKNFHGLLKKKTKWFGLKTVSDPIKNIKSIKPESDQEPNPYFTSILEQYRNALSRVFGESEAKQITNAINSYKGKTIGDAATVKESLIKIFDNAISATDMSKYTIFKDLDKALNALIDSYDKNIKEAISNNRTILDKKLKKDGLVALWGKYMNILRTNKQQFVDDFNKSPEYTYLRDFLRSTMISLLVSLLERIGGSEEQEEVEDIEDEDIVDPEDNPEDDIVEDFSVRFESINKNNKASESYTFGELINKLYEEEFGEDDNSINEVKLIVESTSDKSLGKILCIVKSAEEGYQDEIIKSIKNDISGDFSEQDTDHLSFANLDNTEYPCYTNEGAENEKVWSTVLNLADLADSIAFHKEESPYLVCVAYPMDEDSNLLKDDLNKVQIAEWKYEAEDGPGPEDDDNDDDVVDPNDDVDPEDDPINPEEDNKDIEVYINGKKIETSPSDLQEDSENGKIESSDDYGIRIKTSSEKIKSVLIVLSTSVIKTYKDIAEAVKDKANKLVIRPFQSMTDEFESSYYVSQKEFETNSWKFITIVPRTETSNRMTSGTTEFDLSKEGYFSRNEDEHEPEKHDEDDSTEEFKNLPAIVPTGEITKSNEFRIDLNASKEIALNYTKCVVVLASSEEFFKSMTRDNELTFKSNVDRVPYYRKDAFKVLASADNYSAIYINFGEDTTALRGIKFDPAFIEFKPGDEVWFKIYPVREVGGHLELNLEGASRVGSYKFGNVENQNTKLLTINPKGQLTNNNEFRIDLNVKDRNLANRFKMCVTVLSSSRQFLESMTSENENAFKHNVDSIKYVQSDKFKILAMDKNYTVVLINFGNDTSTLSGIKFAPGFITFNPGDEIFFKIYPVSVDNDHLVLHTDLASAIGMYKFENQNVQQNVHNMLPNQKQLPSGQKQIEASDTANQNQLPANNTPTQE